MNWDMNEHQAHITRPDDSAKVVREAIPPAAQVKVLIPRPSDEQGRLPPSHIATSRHRARFYGMPFAWRGLHLLGVAIGTVVVWFVVAWIRHGRMPLGLSMPEVRLSIGTPPSPILPPTWLVAIVGLLTLVSIAMMLSGTQDANPKLKFRKHESPNQTSDATSEPAP